MVLLSPPPSSIASLHLEDWIIPSPESIIELSRVNFRFRAFSGTQIVGIASRAFLKLGRDEDAVALASLAVAPEEQTAKKGTLVDCHCVLGVIASKRGNMEEASGHFQNALIEAKQSGLPMLEVVVARDWRECVLAPSGQDCAAVDAVTDGACAKMNKSRNALSAVLQKSGGMSEWTQISEN